MIAQISLPNMVIKAGLLVILVTWTVIIAIRNILLLLSNSQVSK